jgi:hypothetical protein
MENLPLVFIGIAAVIGLAALWEVFQTRCPSCKKMFARRIDKAGRSYRGDNHGSLTGGGTDNYVRYSWTRQCTCKFCGHRWEQRGTSSRRRD